MRLLIWYIVTPIMHVISRLFFYDGRYLTGRFFAKNRFAGWVWVAKGIWFQKILGFNRRIPWPVSHTTTILNHKNIFFHPDDMNNFLSPGCYYQNVDAKIVIGKGSYIGPNVGIITANHQLENLDKHQPGRDVVLGEQCWIGMNAVLLPGVVLGDHTVVAAGAVVSRSFPAGYCVLGGVPAKQLKTLRRATDRPE